MTNNDKFNLGEPYQPDSTDNKIEHFMIDGFTNPIRISTRDGISQVALIDNGGAHTSSKRGSRFLTPKIEAQSFQLYDGESALNRLANDIAELSNTSPQYIKTALTLRNLSPDQARRIASKFKDPHMAAKVWLALSSKHPEAQSFLISASFGETPRARR